MSCVSFVTRRRGGDEKKLNYETERLKFAEIALMAAVWCLESGAGLKTRWRGCGVAGRGVLRRVIRTL